ncbi:Scn11a [Symbiodinium natans]|uniref:Scn11a protein n=1 Tax=Symbiodinium natans TaxID=878477 RepID=A0A812L9Q7_9DINO|nr:Scn11a [Symbiodinium natans]
MSEHTELLTEQYDMLNEQLDLLAGIPGLEEKAKEVSSKRRSAKVLRRQGKRQGKPQFFEDDGTNSNTASSYLPADAANPVEIIKSLETTCQDFENVQGQLNTLLAKAEQLTMAALESPPILEAPSASPSRGASKSTLGTEGPREPVLSRGPSKTFSDGLSTVEEEKKSGVRFRSRPHPLLEEHYASLLSTFHKRVQEEESFQERCRHVIRSLDALMEGRQDPGKYFVC